MYGFIGVAHIPPDPIVMQPGHDAGGHQLLSHQDCMLQQVEAL